MAEYIDLDKLKEFPIRAGHYDQEHGNEHFIYGIETVLEYAEQLPPADVAPVVRCQDCKYCFCNHDGHIQCSNSMGLICPARNAYCCYGEEA